ncbi:t-complex protein 1 subunit alpha [Plasmopara halstedii]|uniref:T-complex protein 1 subunit alpha n=1 Tax=Plasmopara halstedii TaxID=4781 RepID=A0A0P1ARL5_PLAHL|nr:t-complex protein 1 subunit alpha [Plasmopara halstedii]CEG44005.1 t-complex protein 1 subunit alpha [Plasmopara halstedii]|eukprot:XP_024580374.1 t-complex protein 1 subunit alpha [Plasmopara halstedii]
MKMQECIVFLQAVVGVSYAVRSLYGPNKLHELGQTLFTKDTYTVASVLQSQNAGTAILQKALDEQHKFVGSSCSTVVTLCGVLAETVIELLKQGLDNNVIQKALSSAMTCCVTVALSMRIPLSEAIPSFHNLTRTQQLEVIVRILSTDDDQKVAANLAVNVILRLDSSRFCGDELLPLSRIVTSHVVLGGATSAISSQVFDGLLLPVAEDSLRSALSHKLALNVDLTTDKGIVILNGDLDTITFSCDFSIQVIFVHGEISARTIDAFVSSTSAPLCIPIASYESLRQLAEMSGAHLVDSWEELLPNAIGHEKIQIKAHEFTVSSINDKDDDEAATLYIQILRSNTKYHLHASIVVQGSNNSLAEELQNEIYKMICRIRNTLRSKYVLPGNGSFWCACAAVIKKEAEVLALSKLELLSFAVAKLANSFNQLGVIMLGNTTEESYCARLARVHTVQQRFVRSIQDVGLTKFFSCYFDFRNTNYALSLSPGSEPDNVDEYSSMTFALQRSFRVIKILLNIDRHQVN